MIVCLQRVPDASGTRHHPSAKGGGGGSGGRGPENGAGQTEDGQETPCGHLENGHRQVRSVSSLGHATCVSFLSQFSICVSPTC